MYNDTGAFSAKGVSASAALRCACSFLTFSLIIGWLTETVQKSNGNRKTSAKCTFYLGKAPEFLL